MIICICRIFYYVKTRIFTNKQTNKQTPDKILSGWSQNLIFSANKNDNNSAKNGHISFPVEVEGPSGTPLYFYIDCSFPKVVLWGRRRVLLFFKFFLLIYFIFIFFNFRARTKEKNRKNKKKKPCLFLSFLPPFFTTLSLSPSPTSPPLPPFFPPLLLPLLLPLPPLLLVLLPSLSLLI